MSTDETREIPNSGTSQPTPPTSAAASEATGARTTAATTASSEPDPRPARRPRVGWHDTDVTSLVFGLLFLGIAAVWLLVQQDVVSWPDASRIFPVVLVAAGVIGLVSSLTRSRRSRRDEQPYPPA